MSIDGPTVTVFDKGKVCLDDLWWTKSLVQEQDTRTVFIPVICHWSELSTTFL